MCPAGCIQLAVPAVTASVWLDVILFPLVTGWLFVRNSSEMMSVMKNELMVAAVLYVINKWNCLCKTKLFL